MEQELNFVASRSDWVDGMSVLSESSFSSLTLFSSLFCDQDEMEWPSLQSLHSQPQQQQAFALRETSKDSGIHEMTEEKRRSAKRKE